MRVSFSTMTAARAAVRVLEAYGYTATRFGTKVVTDCPILLAIPAIQKRIGLGEIEQVDLSGNHPPIEPDPDSPESHGASYGDFRYSIRSDFSASETSSARNVS